MDAYDRYGYDAIFVATGNGKDEVDWLELVCSLSRSRTHTCFQECLVLVVAFNGSFEAALINRKPRRQPSID